MRRVTVDFETRSRVDLKVVGAWAYSRHESTDATCLGWQLNERSGQWQMGDPPPGELFAVLDVGIEVEAHNAFFEWCIWKNVCVRKYGWPAILDWQWRCSASRAAAMSIPRSLSGAGNAMDLDEVKDEFEGKSALTKTFRPMRNGEWCEDEEVWAKMLAYNRQDVRAEHELGATLLELTAQELAVWRMSERMNRRGVMFDRPGVEAAVKIAGQYTRLLTAEFHDLTGLDTAGQRMARRCPTRRAARWTSSSSGT